MKLYLAVSTDKSSRRNKARRYRLHDDGDNFMHTAFPNRQYWKYLIKTAAPGKDRTKAKPKKKRGKRKC